MSTTTTEGKPLKRLGFVHKGLSYAQGYTTAAGKLYSRARSVVPASIAPYATKAEETVASYAAPLLARVQDTSDKALHYADDGVDFLLTSADKTVKSTQTLHETNFKVLSEAAAGVKQKVVSVATWGTEHLNPVKAAKGALATVSSGLATAQAALDPDVAAKMATDAWAKFSSNPYVHKAIEITDPVTTPIFKGFSSAHDNVVGWTSYKKVVDAGLSTLGWATSTTPYKLGAQYVYPLVQPVADPALDKLNKSKVVQDAVGYWKPTAAAA